MSTRAQSEGSIMFRKVLTVLATSAVIAGGSAGVAYADTPVKSSTSCSVSTGGVLGTITGILGGNGSCLLPGGLGGGLSDGDHHHHLPGGGFGGGLRGGDFGGTFWQRDGVILPFNQVSSACGCSGNPASFGYTLVEPQVQVVPVGVAAGDGSCATLNQIDWTRGGFQRGARFFRR
jgi:hypothetical protein